MKRLLKMKDKWARHHALVELWIGIASMYLLAEVIVLLIPGQKLYRSLGLLIGIIGAFFLVWHMEYTIDRSLGCFEKEARGIMWQGYMVRYGIEAVLLLIAIFSGVADPIFVFIGLLFIKFAAYLQPLTHKISEAVCGKEVFFREMVPEEEQYPEEFNTTGD